KRCIRSVRSVNRARDTDAQANKAHRSSFKAVAQSFPTCRDTFRLLLAFAQERLRRAPSKHSLEALNAPFISEFPNHLEKTRSNGARSRNLRLAAIRSFFRYAALEAPQHAGLIQRVLA